MAQAKSFPEIQACPASPSLARPLASNVSSDKTKNNPKKRRKKTKTKQPMLAEIYVEQKEMRKCIANVNLLL